MVFATLCAAALLSQVQGSEALTVNAIPIQKVASCYLLTRLALGSESAPGKPIHCPLIPEFELSADARANCLIAKGPRSKVPELMRIVALYDVDPMRVQVRLKYEVPQFGLTGEASIALATNVEADYNEPSVDFQLKVKPRINGDGTVTLSLDATRAGLRTAMVARIKSGWSLGWTGGRNAVFEFDREPTRQEWADRGFTIDSGSGQIVVDSSPSGFRIWCTASAIPRSALKNEVRQ